MTPEKSVENFRIAVHEFGHYEVAASYGIAASPKVFTDAEKRVAANGNIIVGVCLVDALSKSTPFQQSAIGWAGYLAEHLCQVQSATTGNPFRLNKRSLRDFYLASRTRFEEVFSHADQCLICAYRNPFASLKSAYERLHKKRDKILRLARREQSIRSAELRRAKEAAWGGVPPPPGELATHADFVRLVCGNEAERFEQFILSRAQYELIGGGVESFEAAKQSMLASFLGQVSDKLRARHAGKTDAEIAGMLFDENFASILNQRRRIYGGDFPHADSWFAAARDFLNWAASQQ